MGGMKDSGASQRGVAVFQGERGKKKIDERIFFLSFNRLILSLFSIFMLISGSVNIHFKVFYFPHGFLLLRETLGLYSDVVETRFYWC